MEEELHESEELLQKCSPESGVAFSSSGCFDCNICLEFAVDPVVTLCGHLYCWPCIYKWLERSIRSSLQHCPVCKATLSQDTLVPLYGRGNSSNKSNLNVDIPQRPSVQRKPNDNQYSQLHHSHQQEYPYVDPSSDYVLPSLHSTAHGVLTGMAVDLLPLIFRNGQFSRMNIRSSYYTIGIAGSQRLRRQELEVQRSLHQMSVFLFYGVILCLLLF